MLVKQVMKNGELVLEPVRTTISFRLDPSVSTAKTPTRSYNNDLGFDIYSAEDFTIYSGEPIVVRTGVHCIFPDGYGAFIKDRSSMASKGVYTHGGVIDNGYTGEIKIILSYTNTKGSKDTPFINFKAGDKIAQMVLVPVPYVASTVISEEQFNELSGEKERGERGFGSTGN